MMASGGVAREDDRVTSTPYSTANPMGGLFHSDEFDAVLDVARSAARHTGEPWTIHRAHRPGRLTVHPDGTVTIGADNVGVGADAWRLDCAAVGVTPSG